MTACQIVWKCAGKPAAKRTAGASEQPGRCALCGGWDKRSVPLAAACPPASFSGYPDMQWPSSNRACRACAWATEGKPPNTLRMWTIVAREDGEVFESAEKAPGIRGVHLTNKGNFDFVGEMLLSPPQCAWCVAVADSGKIHVLPYTPMNRGGGRWQVRMDRENIYGTPEVMGKMIHHIASLIAAGYRRGSVLGRNPSPSELNKHGIDIWKKHIVALPEVGGSAGERLATMIARKDSAHEWAGRTREYA